MTTTETTTGQLILSPEQAEDHARCCGWPLTLTFDVEPQPELQREQNQAGRDRWLFGGCIYVELDDMNFHNLHVSLLRLWWQKMMGNTGSPQAGMRVKLISSELTDPDVNGWSPVLLATATLAAVPRVEREPEIVTVNPPGNSPFECAASSRFIIRAEVRP